MACYYNSAAYVNMHDCNSLIMLYLPRDFREKRHLLFTPEFMRIFDLGHKRRRGVWASGYKTLKFHHIQYGHLHVRTSL